MRHEEVVSEANREQGECWLFLHGNGHKKNPTSFLNPDVIETEQKAKYNYGRSGEMETVTTFTREKVCHFGLDLAGVT